MFARDGATKPGEPIEKRMSTRLSPANPIPVTLYLQGYWQIACLSTGVDMTKAQRIVALTGTLLILASGLYPPWRTTYSEASGGSPRARFATERYYTYEVRFSRVQYAIVFRAPGADETLDATFVSAEPDLPRLILEWVTIVLITGGLCIVLTPSRKVPSP
jgi:hypothetical protein